MNYIFGGLPVFTYSKMAFGSEEQIEPGITFWCNWSAFSPGCS
jgi:hypothetical protein